VLSGLVIDPAIVTTVIATVAVSRSIDYARAVTILPSTMVSANFSFNCDNSVPTIVPACWHWCLVSPCDPVSAIATATAPLSLTHFLYGEISNKSLSN
jgi:hypothetical protein